MDALWNLEDKWKISTRKAVLLLVSITVLVVLVSAVVVVMILRRKASRKNRIACLDLDDDDNDDGIESSSSSSLVVMHEDQNVILSSPCWSMAHRWNNNNEEDYMVKCKCWKEMNLMSKCVKFSCCLGSKLKPIWQRPILMGEKCVFPKFSGLILYDEKGRPLPHNNVGQVVANHHDQQEGSHIAGRSPLLKDLL